MIKDFDRTFGEILNFKEETSETSRPENGIRFSKLR